MKPPASMWLVSPGIVRLLGQATGLLILAIVLPASLVAYAAAFRLLPGGKRGLLHVWPQATILKRSVSLFWLKVQNRDSALSANGQAHEDERPL